MWKAEALGDVRFNVTPIEKPGGLFLYDRHLGTFVYDDDLSPGENPLNRFEVEPSLGDALISLVLTQKTVEPLGFTMCSVDAHLVGALRLFNHSLGVAARLRDNFIGVDACVFNCPLTVFLGSGYIVEGFDDRNRGGDDR